ncbi:MAG: AMP-binding protein [Pseudomonadota bacterium]
MTARPLLITSGLRASAARSPDKIAMSCDGEGTRTYAELVGRIDALRAAGEHVWGLKHGDVVALIAPNCLAYFEIVSAFSELGVAVATINYRLSAPEVAQIVSDSTAQLVFYHPSCAALAEPLEGVTLISTDAPIPQAPPASSVIAQETDTFAIPYTSGTTGLPKGVMISHRSRAMTFYAMAAEYQCYSSASHFLAIAPFCHGAGFAFGFAPLFFGGRVDILAAFDAETVLRKIAEGACDGIFMVPTHFQALFDLSPEILEACRGKHRLRTIISNASALPQPMKETIISYFGEGLLHETYGSTEGGIVTNLRPHDQLRKQRCVGPAFVDTEISLRDGEGNEVPDDTPGELFSRGPCLFSGYWNRPDATQEAVQGDWVSVGDIAVRDSEGYIYIVDRKKDMIISGGINVYPREIENVLADHAAIKDSAVFGISDPAWGESICAALVLNDGAGTQASDITQWLEGRIARFKVPRTIHFVDALPRNANGKVLKHVLSKTYSAA